MRHAPGVQTSRPTSAHFDTKTTQATVRCGSSLKENTTSNILNTHGPPSQPALSNQEKPSLENTRHSELFSHEGDIPLSRLAFLPRIGRKGHGIFRKLTAQVS
ncbi:hypothetical protein ABW19_dt0203967 [Dactylella cylindrospora]|nr:hypothetical protein ABW19_dt0203967 [Dactylella cylindrospora]